jgi:HK97 gp10 family phage protein
MADGVRVRVIGGEKLAAALKALDAAAAEKALRLAVEAGAWPIENAAKQKAPYRTGTLRRSIRTDIEADSTHAEAKIGPSATAAPYAAAVEFGHLTRKGGNGWQGPQNFVPARPYLRPAWDENIDAAERKMRAVLKTLIAKAAQK